MTDIIDTDIIDMGLVQLREAIATRAVSCREVMAATLARIEAVNGAANAIVSLRDGDALLAEADEADDLVHRGEPLGALHGIPQAPKDLTATRDIPTTLGSPILADFLPPEDAIVVTRARAAGAILIGKTNVPEFGLGSHTYNPLFGITPNAWDPAVTAGGSSGGAAVALALRMLPVADGSDMGGSLRNPAGWNNVVGFRPSQGRVPSAAPELFIAQLATDGPMGRTVADTAALLAVQAGYHPRAPLSLGDPWHGPEGRGLAGVRVAWLGDLGGHLPTEPGVLPLCEAALHHLEAAGATVEPFVPAFDWERLWRAWLTLRSQLVAGSAGALYADHRDRMKPELVGEIEAGHALTGRDVYAASVTRSDWYRTMLAAFERFDILVLPTAQVFPFPVETHWPKEIAGRTMDTYHRWMEVAIGPTLAGLPVAAVPAGFSDGRPMGLQIIGRPRADAFVLEVAAAYEASSAFARLRPPEPA